MFLISISRKEKTESNGPHIDVLTRLHLKELGYPIVNDDLYNDNSSTELKEQPYGEAVNIGPAIPGLSVHNSEKVKLHKGPVKTVSATEGYKQFLEERFSEFDNCSFCQENRSFLFFFLTFPAIFYSLYWYRESFYYQ